MATWSPVPGIVMLSAAKHLKMRHRDGYMCTCPQYCHAQRSEASQDEASRWIPVPRQEFSRDSEIEAGISYEAKLRRIAGCACTPTCQRHGASPGEISLRLVTRRTPGAPADAA